MRTVGAYEAKTHLSRLLTEVENGEIFLIERNGKPVAELRPPASAMPALTPDEALDRILKRRGLRLNGVSIRELIEEGREN